MVKVLVTAGVIREKRPERCVDSVEGDYEELSR